MPGAKDIGPERRDTNGISNISRPTLTYLAPAVDRANGTAALICPGGGYSMVSYDREGLQYARWLSTLGITSFILKYRLKEFGHPAPLQDVLRAMLLLRSRCSEFRIDPARIGIIGSSAGGHLAACACTLHDHPLAKTGDPLDAVSARPDFAILLYPVITMEHLSAHSGSRLALLGRTPTRHTSPCSRWKNTSPPPPRPRCSSTHSLTTWCCPKTASFTTSRSPAPECPPSCTFLKKALTAWA
jgi:acetyl esterase/lipase